MKTILTKRLLKILVDDADFQDLDQHKWHLSGRYIMGWIKINQKNQKVLIHRYIMNPNRGEVIDHINGDTLDNRRKNLRICTLRQNLFNQKLSKSNTSGYKGVSWNKNANKWQAVIGGNNRKKRYKGLFNTAIEAAQAYNNYAIANHGEFARLNVI